MTGAGQLIDVHGEGGGKKVAIAVSELEGEGKGPGERDHTASWLPPVPGPARLSFQDDQEHGVGAQAETRLVP